MFAFFTNCIKTVFLLGLLVFIHEGGHFIVAKFCKVRVNEFALGFGPTIWKKQGKETKYALRLIPLGGFVSMEGEEERSLKEGSFSKASIIKRIAIVAAGGMVNILFALIIFFGIVLTSKQVTEYTIVNKIYYSAKETLNLGFSSIESLKQIFSGNISKDQLMGPVGISNLVSSTSGIKSYIYLISLISLSLGITNLLPFPPLDGGKIVLLLIEAIRRKPLKQETEMFIQSLGFFILIALSIYISYNDILKIF